MTSKWTPEALAMSEALRDELTVALTRVATKHRELTGAGISGKLQEGVIDWRADVPSVSGGEPYFMVRTANGWQHADTRCRGWLIRGECHHVKELNLETALVTTKPSILAVFDEIEDEEITTAISAQVTKSWVYEFPMGGQTVRGISAVGVEEAAGELAKHGEAIRVIDMKIEYEDENEARFIVQAGRYAIGADGREALLDVTIRGKRQPKTLGRRDGRMVPDESWYEKGITKATRNAKLALLPEYAKTHILAEAVKAGRVRQVANPKETRPDPHANQIPPAAQRRAPAPSQSTLEVCEHEPKFDADSTLMVCSKCGTVLEEPPAK